MRKGISLALAITHFPKTQEMTKEIVQIFRKTTAMINSMSNGNIELWIKAAKRHKEEISIILAQIIEISKRNGISNPIYKVSRHRIEFLDESCVIEEESIQPRSFWPMYNLLRYVQYCEDSKQLVTVQRVIVTTFMIYKDLGVLGQTLYKRVESHISEMKDNNLQRNKTTDYINQAVIPFLDTVSKAVSSGSFTSDNQVMNSFLVSIKRTRDRYSEPQMSPDQLPLSTKSSGTSCNSITVPSFLASAYEDNNIISGKCYEEFRKRFNYESFERISSLSNMRFAKNKAIAIPHKSKDDARIIHVASNAVQDILHVFAEMDKSLLKNRPQIAIWDQQKAVDKVQTWFAKNSKAVYSLDLHAATDTLDRYQQLLIHQYYWRWLGYEENDVNLFSEVWINLMSLPVKIVVPGDKPKTYSPFTMITGQPMGFEDSVYSLNLSHDIWATALAWYCEENYNMEYVGHVILGDDFCISFKHDVYSHDGIKDFRFPIIYKSLMQELNTECNLTKGFIYNPEVNCGHYDIPLAEFAKNLICGGINITSLPLGALFHCNTLEGQLSFLKWLLDHESRTSVIPYDKLMENMPDGYKDIATLMMACEFQNQFHRIVLGDHFTVFRQKDQKVVLAVELAFAKNVILLKTLSGLNNDTEYVPRVTDYFSFSRNWRKFVKPILNQRDKLKSNKFINMINELELIAAAESIAVDDLLAGASWLKGDEENDITQIIPEIRTIFKGNTEDYLLLLDLISSSTGEEDNQGIDDPMVISTLLSRMKELFKDDLLDTGRRFGSSTDGTKIISGMNLDQIKLDVNSFAEKLNVSSDDIDDTLSYLNSIYSNRHNPAEGLYWETETLEQYQEEDEEESELMSFLEDLTGLSFN